MEKKLFEIVNDGQYVVIANCSDGQVIISKDGNYGFNSIEEAVAIRDEHRFDNSVEVSVYLVQGNELVEK